MGVSDRAWRVCVRVKTREEALGCLFLGGSRARGRGSRPRASGPRARLDAYLLLRQAERHQQALPQPHAFVGVGRSAGACAPRARVWAERVRPRCTRERATFDFWRAARRCGRGKKAALVARIHQFAPTPPVSPRHASPKWAAITGAANATDTGCVVHTTLGARPFATRRAASIARSRLVDFLRSIRATRKHFFVSSARSTPGRACHLLSAHNLLSRLLTHSSPPYTRRRMAATTAAAAAAGSALPR